MLNWIYVANSFLTININTENSWSVQFICQSFAKTLYHAYMCYIVCNNISTHMCVLVLQQ